MKYIKTFEYQVYTTSGTLGKMYSGRFTDTLLKHCMMLDRRGIEYEIFVDEDELKGNQDVVFIVINNDYKQEYFTIFKALGFSPINTKEISNLTKFNSIQSYLKTKKLDETILPYFKVGGFDEDGNIVIHPVDSKGRELENGDLMIINEDEYNELEDKGLAHYDYDYSTGLGQHQYCVDDADEIEDFLELIRKPEYKIAKKYNL